MLFSFTKTFMTCDLETINRVWYSAVNYHTFYIEDEELVDQILLTEWFQKSSQITREIIRKSFVASINGVKRDPKCIVCLESSERCYNPIEAEIYLSQPYVILLENALNDSSFIMCLLRCFKKQGKLISKAIEDNCLQFGMGGGSTIVDFIKNKVNSYKNIKHPPKYFLRLFVLVDSDKKYPEESYSKNKLDLINLCEAYDIPFHILEKREIENYLPDIGLDELIVDSNRTYISGIKKLNPVQRDFFDFEKGFNIVNMKHLDANILTFYADKIENSGDELRKHDFSASDTKFKTKIADIYRSEMLSREHLLERCIHHSMNKNESPYNPNELPDLLVKISNEL